MEQYAISIITCSLCCGIVAKMISDSKKKELFRLITGIILAITLLNPLSGIQPEKMMIFSLPDFNTENMYTEAGEKKAQAHQAESIKTSCEAYILDKAKTLGANIQIQIALGRDLLPVSAEICMDTDKEKKLLLQEILTKDLGIPKEHQKWKWNQENNSS